MYMFFLSVLLFILLAELICRLGFHFYGLDINAYRKNINRYEASKFMGYKGSSNFSLNHITLKDHHNSRGYKDNEFNVTKSEHLKRIITLGGSSVYGFGLENIQSWPNILELELNGNDQFSKYEVINLAIPGYTTAEKIGQMHSIVADLNPDIIILYQGWNDSKYFSEFKENMIVSDVIGNLFIKKFYFTDYSYFLTFIQAIVNKHNSVSAKRTREQDGLAKDPKLVIPTLNTHGFKVYIRNLKFIASMSNALNAKLLLCSQLTLYKENNNDIEKSMLSFGNFDYYYNALKLCDIALKEVAEQNNNVFFVNVKTQIESNIENLQDHIHPTFTGSKKIANVLADFINKIF